MRVSSIGREEAELDSSPLSLVKLPSASPASKRWENCVSAQWGMRMILTPCTKRADPCERLHA